MEESKIQDITGNSQLLSPELKAVEEDIRIKAETPSLTSAPNNGIISNIKTDNDYFYKAPINSPQKIALEVRNYNIEDAYAPLSDGTYIAKYDTYKAGANNNEIHAQSQGTGEKWLNGLAKLGGKT